MKLLSYTYTENEYQFSALEKNLIIYLRSHNPILINEKINQKLKYYTKKYSKRTTNKINIHVFSQDKFYQSFKGIEV